MNFGDKSVAAREMLGGLISTELKVPITSREDLSTFYSPGIAEPCRRIAQNKELSRTLTVRKNTIAVVSDGSAVLGLGNIGPEAALPVMEGKAMLFKQFGGVDAVPIVLDTQDVEEIVDIVCKIAPSFGGINLEDISAPRCFEIERRLNEMLDIPVFHDDQHGTAIVVLAALRNALQVVGKNIESIRVVISGAGAAGIAIDTLLRAAGIKQIELADSQGMVCCAREDLNHQKRDFCSLNCGSLAEGIRGADVFIGVSKGGLLSAELVKTMAPNPIIFALANPDPEILPEEAKKGGAAIIATGRSDFPNQINNVLVFPGLFRGLLDARINTVTMEMKIAAADALARLVAHPTAEKIIPGPFDRGVAETVADAIRKFQ
jgi:malate dehydrogenase (oxaloacetate-decarboxylating)